jgi:hypothetical protein
MRQLFNFFQRRGVSTAATGGVIGMIGGSTSFFQLDISVDLLSVFYPGRSIKEP